MNIQPPLQHCHCAVCCAPFFSETHTLQFNQTETGRVCAQIVATEKMQGYQGVMQGGLISTLHDAAMTYCLFAQCIYAMTAELNVRYLHPIPLNVPLQVEAHLIKQKRHIYYLCSTIFYDGLPYSTASAKFMCKAE
ncbi:MULTISPECIES: PaaI family thioesterase [unclassified Vibrio]|uniref:PaaI family thioesterase n=1 Tax=unclassified Vibrio TaxID=2614977 RepID=UPI000B8E964F|nr:MULTISPECIES: PaaI family thioesterase [unclassified Vibrio]NAX18289.1 PaaI family thioesterase [Vibrio sp. V22_P2S10T140]OXX39680.1 thioesterase [Vibrio sp. V07_P2A8T137]OXX57848.1 thioesterase [Vibrio sp. V10_P2A27P122]PSD41942.1 PaaI family thioesterase [Vibrio sp. V02_P2A34T13]